MKKTTKVFLFILLIAFSFGISVFAETLGDDFNTAPGELIIPFEKIWQDVEVKDRKPIKITLYKYIGDNFDVNNAIKISETVEIDENSDWKYNFDISKEPLIDSDGNHYKFKIIEEMEQGFEQISVKDPEVSFSPPTAETFDILSSNSLTNIPLETLGDDIATIIAATMTSEDKDKFICGPNGNQQCDVIIWTQLPLSPAERVLVANFVSNAGANFKKAAYVLNADGTIKTNTVYFISGSGKLGGMSVGTDTDGIDKVMFDATSKWSHVLTGTYTPSQASSIKSTITNTIKKVDLIVEKKWNDSNDILELRPFEVTIQLLKNGNVIKEVILSDSNSWTHEFKGLPEYTNGQKNDYTVKELNVDGYTSDTKIDGNKITITNTHEVIPTEVTINKVWNNVDQIENLPGVIVGLYYKVSEDDEFHEISRITLNESNNWKYTFSNGKDIVNGKVFDILPSDYIYEVREIGLDISNETEKSFYEDFFITDYSHTGNNWTIINTCTATYILPETGNSGGLILSMVVTFFLATPIIYLIYSFIKKRYTECNL